jgi:membrane-associated phospholipid phosphatase
MNFYKYLVFILLIPFSSFSQINNEDSLATSPKKTKWYKTRVVKASIAPVILIGYGVSTIKGNGIYSSYDAQKDLQRGFAGYDTDVDDYLQFVPYAELALLNLLKIKCQNDFINTGLLILKSQIVMTAIVFPLKSITKIQRPDGSDFHSFPSGHTAQAFVAASIIHKEFRHRSQWYGIGAYAIATSVGFFRMANNKHWQSDVFAGAGIGILSSHIAYLTHRYKWGRKGTCLMPSFYNGSRGFALTYRF